MNFSIPEQCRIPDACSPWLSPAVLYVPLWTPAQT
jgi:hypothetical protein